MINKKPDAARLDYLKKMRSPEYRKRIKRTTQQLNDYNRDIRGGAISKEDIRSIANFFVDDIRPVNFRTANSNDKPAENILKGSVKMS
jgi:hypothetical protein